MTDVYGKEAKFSGEIVWMIREGSLIYENKKPGVNYQYEPDGNFDFKGKWNDMGHFIDGKRYDSYGRVVEVKEDGESYIPDEDDQNDGPIHKKARI
jgi:hypothetical protein